MKPPMVSATYRSRAVVLVFFVFFCGALCFYNEALHVESCLESYAQIFGPVKSIVITSPGKKRELTYIHPLY